MRPDLYRFDTPLPGIATGYRQFASGRRLLYMCTTS